MEIININDIVSLAFHGDEAQTQDYLAYCWLPHKIIKPYDMTNVSPSFFQPIFFITEVWCHWLIFSNCFITWYLYQNKNVGIVATLFCNACVCVCVSVCPQIAKDAKECVQECVSEFISFITSEASERCHQEKRKTINGEDILFAMSTLGFDMYVEPLKLYLQKFREVRYNAAFWWSWTQHESLLHLFTWFGKKFRAFLSSCHRGLLWPTKSEDDFFCGKF